ncbi:T9SS type A sorting domain-containing protein [candidate division KSB1 bacterium]|nr:T9SS type A sorting domain-containing protein [candidate division KSB1 bacterium]
MLFENAPRWSSSSDEAISGKGYFGVELGNFESVQPGDSIHVVLTCFATEEQVVASDRVTAIPWYRWPMHLTMERQDFPKSVDNLTLQIHSSGHRILDWSSLPGVQYDLYRSPYDSLLSNGLNPQVYERIAAGLLHSPYLDSTQFGRRHHYILLARQGKLFGRHSHPLTDFPAPVTDVQSFTGLSGGDTILTLSWSHPETDELYYRVYRDTISVATLMSESRDPFYQQPVDLNQEYCFQIVAVNAISNTSDPTSLRVFAQPPTTDKPDPSVLFISRSPKYPRFSVIYEPGGYNPARDPRTVNQKNYPDAGELMTYTATFQNKGGVTALPFIVEWSVDSLVVRSKEHASLQPGQKDRSSIQQPWSGLSQMITCRLISDDDQVTSANDRVSVRSDALSFHFHVEERIKALFDSHENPVGSYSFEDWGRYHLDHLNRYIQIADYPQGSLVQLESVFLDTVSYYENGRLPAGGTHAPDNVLWDGQWGFTGDDDAYAYFKKIVLEKEFGTDWALLHELGHQLGLIDLYNQDVHLNQVQVIEPRTGAQIPLTPIAWEVVYYSSRQKALMHSNYRAGFSDHSAGALARNRGKRRGFFGDYLADIPAENALLIRNPDGTPVADAEVWVYQKQDNVIPDKAKFKGRSDAEGIFYFPHQTAPEFHPDLIASNPFSTVFSDAPHVVGTNATLLLRIALPEKVAYEFMDICDFNVAYWRGDIASAQYTLPIWHWYPIAESGVGVESGQNNGYRFSLEQNAPNPFNGSTEFSFALPHDGKTTLFVFNMTGQIVATLVDQNLFAGQHSFKWTTNLPSGIYFARLQSERLTQFRKILLLR